MGILSAHGKSDAAYITYAGTSMAAPLVTGAVALLYSAKPEASMAEIRWVGGGASSCTCVCVVSRVGMCTVHCFFRRGTRG